MSFTFPTRPVVVDSSVAVELVMGGSDVHEAWSRWTEKARLLLVPVHFWLELCNGLLLGRRLPSSEIAGRVRAVQESGPETTDRGTWGVLEAVDLADRRDLTVYDAMYLQLALDVEGTLATLDRQLSRAAQAESVDLELSA